MEPITECQIDLFAGDLPSMDEIKKLSHFVHSSERNRLSFSEQVEENISRTGQKASLANSYIWLLRFAKWANSMKQSKACKTALTMEPTQ
jgi:hypothetical protein